MVAKGLYDGGESWICDIVVLSVVDLFYDLNSSPIQHFLDKFKNILRKM